MPIKIVRLLFLTRQAKLIGEFPNLKWLHRPYIEKLFDFVGRTEEEQAAIKHKFGNEKAVRGAPKRIRRVCIDILKHYSELIHPNGFEAMIVTSSRHA